MDSSGKPFCQDHYAFLPALVKGCPGSCICHTLLGNKIMSKNVLPFLLGTDECSLIFKLKLMLKRNIFYVCISFTSEKQLRPVAEMLIFRENSCCYSISGLAAWREIKSSVKLAFSSGILNFTNLKGWSR